MRTELALIKAQSMGKELGDMIQKTDEFRMVLLALLPAFPGLAAAITQAGDDSETASKKTRRFRDEIESLKDAFTGDVGERFFKGLFSSIGDQIASGTKMSDVFQNAGKMISQQIAKGVAANAAASFGSFAGAAIGMGAGLVLGAVAQGIVDYINRGETAAKMREAADQMRTQIFGSVAGGNQALFQDMLERAGQTAREINVIMESGDPEQLARTWDGAARALQQYNNELKGLQQMSGGANLMGQSLTMKLDKSKAEQEKPFLAMQEAAINAMKEAGAAQEAIDAQLAAFAEQNKNRVFTATEEQIGQYNRLGTIVGGTIANMAGRTGDLIGAVLASKDAIQQLLDAQKNFGLGEQTNAATQQVLELYRSITENEDVVLSIQGVTQGLTGMSDAMLQNGTLANAFGQQMAADLEELQKRGVDTATAFAMAAPGLQRLWELQKEGKVALDETTTAMLKQAEEQGVVGENMRNVNEQILDVLTQIRDMFSDEIPRAVPRTTAAVQNGANAQQRAAGATQRAWREAAEQTATSWSGTQEEMIRLNDDAVEHIREKLRNIPSQFPIDVDWKVPRLELPDPDPYQVPVEFELPEDRKPWDEQYPGRAYPQSDPYTAAATTAPGGAMEGGRGAQTIIVERDGQRDLQYTAENLPDYVRIRAGNTVLGV
jgi:hypothetical protein